MMEQKLQNLLDELERAGAANDAVETDRNRKMLNLEPGTARLVAILARATSATRVLEIGTSNGYSTIWLGWAVAPAGGRVISIEKSPEKHAMARENLARAGLENYVELRLGDASEIARELPGPFDLVFFDADRLTAPEQLQILVPKLTPRALLLADNVLSHPDEIVGYLNAVADLSDFEHVVVPVGKGLSIACRAGFVS
jgi:predicted O-methyltransferase YrrM